LRPLRRAALYACVVAALCAAPARGEIYQWTDADGRIHVTDRLDRVPPAQREQVMRGARPETQPDPVQSAAPPASRAPAATRAARLSRELRIPFQREGTLMRVNVRLNDSLIAPFYIDTGASGVALPPEFAQRLGIRVGPQTPQVMVSTANGQVLRPVVMLDSVELGGARVENLEATLSPSMPVGLLGGSFFNNFVYRVDAAQSVITLAPNDGMRGGLDAQSWRARFAEVRSLLERLEAHLQSQPGMHANERELLEGRRAELRAALDALDQEADRLHVPQTWRQ
jgi:clan AA aspartic protease (TIGR02281 family)